MKDLLQNEKQLTLHYLIAVTLRLFILAKFVHRYALIDQCYAYQIFEFLEKNNQNSLRKSHKKIDLGLLLKVEYVVKINE